MPDPASAPVSSSFASAYFALPGADRPLSEPVSAVIAAIEADIIRGRVLPGNRLIEDHLRTLMHSEAGWAYIDFKINQFDAFTDVYGFVAGDEVIRFMAVLIGEVIDEAGWNTLVSDAR